MVFSINEFRAQINGMGLAKNNLFFTRITLPPSLSSVEGMLSTRSICFMCKTVSVPGLTIGTTPIKTLGFGKTEQRPIDFSYGDLSAVFMVDSNFGVKKFFHRWIQEVVNYSTSDGNLRQDPQGKLPYEFAYKQDYVARVEVLVYSGNDASKVYLYTYDNVYPVTVGNVELSWENQAEIMVLPVGFTFDTVATEGIELGAISAFDSRSNGILTYASSLGSVVQAINQLSTPSDIQDIINLTTTINSIFNLN